MFFEREEEVLKTLDKIKKFDFVLIGGYAINAFTQPRFSVDCDLVTKKAEAKKLKEALIKEGYKQEESGKFLRLSKKINNLKVGFDIMMDQVLDRRTNIAFKAEWIFENSKKRTFIGKTIPMKIKVRVANPEVLFIMKLVSGRKADYRDVFMLAGLNLDLNFIKKELNNLNTNLKEQREELEDFINSKNFKDSLQGVFGKVNEIAIKKNIKKLSFLKKLPYR